ncbi:UNVERIFIED_CONTAM: hypothetical protein Slati_0720000 [Sesamum latifolium]|uniref:Uncharacterized protein n=1 Tax=Sesamum latifolium TaxID=2727402 RepID=A0AAW2Y5K0_9LAMI
MNNSRLQENVATDNEEMPGPTSSINIGEDSSSNIRIGKTQPPMRESGEESKSGSEYKGSELEESSDGAEDRMESENDDDTHKAVSGKGHQIVPADEMLSDEYYEQDGDDQTESLNHHRAVNNSSGFSSKPPPRLAADSSISRKSKGLKANKYDDEDADYEEDDDEEEDEDDPDDADFDPDYGATRAPRGIKDKDDDWGAEESDEEDNVEDDDLDFSDDDDVYFKKNKAKQSGKSGRNLKSTRVPRSIASSSRRKKGRTSFEEDDEESSAEESENGSDEDFRGTRRGASVQRKNVGRSASASVSSRNNELRTSGSFSAESIIC